MRLAAARWRPSLLLLFEAAATAAVLFVFLAGWRRDFRVPVAFSRDALEYLMQVKGTLDNGWWWVHPRISAPGVFEQIQFPSNTNVDQAIVWIVGLFTRDPGLAINVSWMIMIVAGALIARACLGLLGTPRHVGFPVALLFAVSPYALYRNIDHFSLATYLVPVPCTLALLAITSRLTHLRLSQWSALMAGCVLIGFNYTYYAFFACFLILAASAVALAADRTPRESIRAIAFAAAICAATAVNLAPSLYAWTLQGRPTSIPEKHAAEAEQYGLKIRHLVSPVLDHGFSPFRRWTESEDDQHYELENENKTSRLGLVASVGFLALLGGVFVPRIVHAVPDPALFAGAGRLTLASLLLATIGGFGSLFNLLVSPQIRAYNRLTPFIAFFSLVAIAGIASRLMTRVANRTGRNRIAGVLLAAFLVALWDQSFAAGPLNRDHDAIREEWTSLGDFVRSLEERLPPGAMVFQLPLETYLSDTGREKMQPLDHIKPYVVSGRARWSYPALADAIVRWQQQVSRLPTRELASAAAVEGFDAILIDRDGYFDRGETLLTELGVADSSNSVIAESRRYVALDLERVRKSDIPADRLPRLGETPKPAATGLSLCEGATQFNLEWIGASAAPFSRQPVRVSYSDEFFVAGWAVDDRHHATAGDVDVVVGDTAYPAFYGRDRPDVSDHFGVPGYIGSGFVVRLTGKNVGRALSRLSLRILSADRTCYYTSTPIQIVAH